MIIYLCMHVFVQCTHHISDCNYTDMLLFPVPSLTSSQRYIHASIKLENNRGQQFVKRYDFLLPVFDTTDAYVRLYAQHNNNGSFESNSFPTIPSQHLTLSFTENS